MRSTNILPQTSYWARVKYRQGLTPGGFQVKASSEVLSPDGGVAGSVEEDLLVLIQYVSDTQCFAYVPYGPKLEPVFENHGVFLEELSEVIRPHLPPNCAHIRYDLLWENQWASEEEHYDEAGNWLGPPPGHTQEFRLNFNTQNWNLRKSPGDLLPKNTFFLDLKQTEEQLLANMRPNTRYNVRRSLWRGIEVKAHGIEMLDTWYALYQETALRQGMVLHPKAYFEQVLAERNQPGVEVKLLMAEYAGQYLASMLLVLSGQRGVYLFGASSGARRELMPSYALQWEAIRLAKAHGCVEYDLFGCAPNLDPSHPLHGVHLYKKGFGGQLFHRMGCWDYPLDLERYELLKAQELQS
ncbi:lipid II:glycine glycyltransferase FemX [Marinoscillum furvescens]|nr:peptidoglycan bridge formation glycyltransferase FemA/FemB family protein [Marinoscillum furvescens]